MINWKLLNPRDFIVIGLMSLIFTILADRIFKSFAPQTNQNS